MDPSQEPKVEGAVENRAERVQLRDAPAHERGPLVGPPLLGEDPTAEDQTIAAPHRHIVFGRQCDYCLSVAAGRRYVAKQVGELAPTAVAQDVAGRVSVM